MSCPICAIPRHVRIACSIFFVAAGLAQPVAAQLAKPAKEQVIGAIASMKHDVQPFGKTNDGQEVKVHTLTNTKGLRVRLIDYGATLISVETPDRNGKSRQHHARLSDARRLPAAASLFRLDGRPLRQPHRRRQVHARRQDLHAGDEQRPESPARRPQGVRRRRCGRPSR